MSPLLDMGFSWASSSSGHWVGDWLPACMFDCGILLQDAAIFTKSFRAPWRVPLLHGNGPPAPSNQLCSFEPSFWTEAGKKMLPWQSLSLSLSLSTYAIALWSVVPSRCKLVSTKWTSSLACFSMVRDDIHDCTTRSKMILYFVVLLYIDC